MPGLLPTREPDSPSAPEDATGFTSFVDELLHFIFLQVGLKIDAKRKTYMHPTPLRSQV